MTPLRSEIRRPKQTNLRLDLHRLRRHQNRTYSSARGLTRTRAHKALRNQPGATESNQRRVFYRIATWLWRLKHSTAAGRPNRVLKFDLKECSSDTTFYQLQDGRSGKQAL